MIKVRLLSTPHLTKDPEADMGYLKLNKAEVSSTIPMGAINVDVDTYGRAIGIEFFNLKEIEDGRPLKRVVSQVQCFTDRRQK